MDLRTFAEGLGYFGSVLGVAMVVPQIVRTYRNRTLPGVSAMSWALTSISCFTWLLYGIRAAEPPQIPGNVLLVSGAVVVVLSVPSARITRCSNSNVLLDRIARAIASSTSG